ncbi:MAG: hypothetical protein ABI831_22325 [Betaproteobacteria bacterium]
MNNTAHALRRAATVVVTGELNAETAVADSDWRPGRPRQPRSIQWRRNAAGFAEGRRQHGGESGSRKRLQERRMGLVERLVAHLGMGLAEVWLFHVHAVAAWSGVDARRRACRHELRKSFNTFFRALVRG